MASADLVQTNGLGLSLASAMKRLMAVENQSGGDGLSEEANRENGSTLSWLAHVSTRPGPKADTQPEAERSRLPELQ